MREALSHILRLTKGAEADSRPLWNNRRRVSSIAAGLRDFVWPSDHGAPKLWAQHVGAFMRWLGDAPLQVNQAR